MDFLPGQARRPSRRRAVGHEWGGPCAPGGGGMRGRDPYPTSTLPPDILKTQPKTGLERQGLGGSGGKGRQGGVVRATNSQKKNSTKKPI